MNSEEAVEYTMNDPLRQSGQEKEFTIHFTKADERARVSTCIRSVMDGLLSHSDFEATDVGVLRGEEDVIHMSFEDFEGDGSIISLRGFIPIESLKIKSNPRSRRSYSNIVSSQEKVSINDD